MYMKKWWLEHTFMMDGHKVEFRGWINTIAEHIEDFPETISGTFWASKIPENGIMDDGTPWMMGMFNLDDGSEGEYNYVFGDVYPVWIKEGICGVSCRADADRIVMADQPLPSYPKFEARIEESLNLDNTHIIEY